jgi:hypothetical protein
MIEPQARTSVSERGVEQDNPTLRRQSI